MIKEAIFKLCNGENLTCAEAESVMREIMNGETEQSQTAALLTALHIKGETTDEIAAFAYVMRDCATRVEYPGDTLEIVGTGGDGAQSINISTISGMVCAAAGAKVAKHGNRAASSKCGAADCLEALGINISTSPDGCVKLLNEVGMCFMFAQRYHTAMKYVGPVRKAIGVPTVFNILGPLTNPAHADLQLLGVYKDELLKPMSDALMRLGVKRGMVVHGEDGLDEISVGAPTKVVEFADGKTSEYTITPEQFGLSRHDISGLRGGDPAENARIARKILGGDRNNNNAGRDAVLLNAGCALHIAKEITIDEGIKLAAETIDSGAALKTLEAYITISKGLD